VKWTGLVWLRIGTGGEFLWIRYWTFGFHEIVGNYRVASLVVLSSIFAMNKWTYSRNTVEGQAVCLWAQLVRHCAMNTCGGVDIYILGTGWRWVVSFMALPLYPHLPPLVDPRACRGDRVKWSFLTLAGLIGSRYTDWATEALHYCYHYSTVCNCDSWLAVDWGDWGNPGTSLYAVRLRAHTNELTATLTEQPIHKRLRRYWPTTSCVSREQDLQLNSLRLKITTKKISLESVRQISR
jgi:hypothetical protein